MDEFLTPPARAPGDERASEYESGETIRQDRSCLVTCSFGEIFCAVEIVKHNVRQMLQHKQDTSAGTDCEKRGAANAKDSGAGEPLVDTSLHTSTAPYTEVSAATCHARSSGCGFARTSRSCILRQYANYSAYVHVMYTPQP